MSDDLQSIRDYALKLVRGLVGQEYDDTVVRSISDELSTTLISSLDGHPIDAARLAAQASQFFLSNSYNLEWLEISRLLEQSRNEGANPQSLLTRLNFFTALLAGADQPPQSPMEPHAPERSLVEDLPPNEVLIRCLSYALLGSDSSLFVFSQPKKLALPPDLNCGDNSTVRAILECGLIFKSIADFIAAQRGIQKSTVKTAFIGALDDTRASYVEYIETVFDDKPTSLSVILVRIDEPLADLRVLYALCNAMLEEPEPTFLSRIHTLSQLGSLQTRKLGTKLFRKTLQPYYNALHQWLLHGKLGINHQDFLASFTENTSNYNLSVVFHPQNLPTFFSKQLGQHIFQVGKTVLFLRTCCDQLIWTNEYVHHYAKVLESSTPHQFASIVEEQQSLVLNRLAIALYGNYEVLSHLTNLKRLFFIQCSDFVDALISKGETTFEVRVGDIQTSAILGLLQEAICTSSLNFCPFSKRIDARLLHASHGNHGWDVFTIDYRINDTPLAPLIGAQSLQYLKMFNFLWKVSHLRSVISDLYIRGRHVLRAGLPGAPDLLKKALRNLLVARHAMQTVLESVLSHLFFDVIENNFDKFMERMINSNQDGSLADSRQLSAEFIASIGAQKSTKGTESHNASEMTLDEFTDNHTRYMQHIINSKLLDPDCVGKTSGQPLIGQLYDIFNTIAEFATGVEEFCLGLSEHKVARSIMSTNGTTDQDELVAIELRLKAYYLQLYRGAYCIDYKQQVSAFKLDLSADPQLHSLASLVG